MDNLLFLSKKFNGTLSLNSFISMDDTKTSCLANLLRFISELKMLPITNYFDLSIKLPPSLRAAGDFGRRIDKHGRPYYTL